MYIYARINKDTLRFIREKKAISFDYVTRITKFKEEKIVLWENDESGKFPTINQAKSIAKCYRIPFAGLYMNASDINVKHLPQMRNLRTLPDAVVDNSALNLAISDILSARDLLLESRRALKERTVKFGMSINCLIMLSNGHEKSEIVLVLIQMCNINARAQGSSIYTFAMLSRMPVYLCIALPA